MKPRFLLASAGLLVAFVTQVPAGAQTQTTAVERRHEHQYRFVDLGTLGGPTFYTVGDDRVSEVRMLNNRGLATGWSATPAPDPFPDFCWDGDCHLTHAPLWQHGALSDLGALVDGVNSDTRWITDNELIAGDSQNGKLDPLNVGFPEIRAVLWKHGRIIDLGTLDGGHESIAHAVNSAGQVVGLSLNTIPDPNSMIGSFFGIGFQQTRAFLWQNGVMKDLGTLGTGTNAIALLINEHGQVAGDSYTSANPSPSCFYNSNIFPLTTGAFLWEKGKMTDLGNLGGTCTLASALNNRGQVAGYSNLAGDQTFHAFRWDPEAHPRLRDLGTLGGSFSLAETMNEAGDAAGGAALQGDEVVHAALWGRDGITDLGVVGGDRCAFAFSINSSHQVVGISGSDCGFVEANAFLSESAGHIIDLNDFVPPTSNLHLRAGITINDRGEILVAGVTPSGDRRAVLLIPCDDEGGSTEGCQSAVHRIDGSSSAGTARPTHEKVSPIDLLRRRGARTQLYHRY